jgi:hypothetical protein
MSPPKQLKKLKQKHKKEIQNLNINLAFFTQMGLALLKMRQKLQNGIVELPKKVGPQPNSHLECSIFLVLE